VPVEEIRELAGRFLVSGQWSYCRRLLARLVHYIHADLDPPVRLSLAQEYATACCLDPTARSHNVLSRALALLEESVDLAQTEAPAILEPAGGLHRRLWELNGQMFHLERALAFFRRSFEHGVDKHKAYAGINAAFLLDVIGHTEGREAAQAGISSPGAEVRRDEAERIRRDIVATLADPAHAPQKQHLRRDWTFVTTVAEAYLGLKQYGEASRWLQRAARLKVPEQVFEATARHLGALVRMQEGPPPVGEALKHAPGWSCLRALVGDNLTALVTAAAGKVGLALSGGGFRAALFHVGVLSRLAELDVLRHIEVISCVSGGSIVGAHYYLELRKLLQEKEDAEITREDYIAIVQRIEHALLAGIQQNIRMQVAAGGLAILRVILDRDYSRTVRAGELYEEEIYSRVEDDQERRLRCLKITPKGAPRHFYPRRHNWRRRAKVPAPVINATALNTGHNWQFTTTWMGEPPSGIPREVDSNERLRRMYYHQAPPSHQDIRLGKAVGASACVPGIFEPVTLSGLYPRRTVRLVDGGVHDNQGIGGVLDEHCKIILVSDASGQMATLHDPGTNVFTVLSRSDNIARVHVRAAQYGGLETRCRTALLHHLMFLHLKKDLDVPVVNWIGCQDPDSTHNDREESAAYGILKKLQERLAAVRTDLDSFCDQEAYALMLSGYLMTAHEFPRRVEGLPIDAKKVDWTFRAIEPALLEKVEPHHGNLHRILAVAPFVAFKIWRLAPALLGVLLLLAGLAVSAAWLAAR
jgi:predicted acylesterase/phospholipase RssA